MTDVMQTKIREGSGRRDAKRLRREGLIPAELYGHKKDNVHLSIPRSEIVAAVRHGAHMVELQGAVTESALIREVQWDHYGTDLLHVDLARVSKEEKVEVSLSVEIRGAAVGTKEGGIIQHVLYEVKILCPAGMIPDKLEAKISNLHVGDQLLARDLELPEGAKLLTSPDQIIAQCVTPLDQADEQAAPAEVSEPELIGRKLKEEEEAEEG